MGNRNDLNGSFGYTVNDGKREAPKDKFPYPLRIARPTVRGFNH